MTTIHCALTALQLSPKVASTVTQRCPPQILKFNHDPARIALSYLKDPPAMSRPLLSRRTHIRYPPWKPLGRRWYARMTIFYLWLWDTGRILMVIQQHIYILWGMLIVIVASRLCNSYHWRKAHWRLSSRYSDLHLGTAKRRTGSFCLRGCKP